MAEALGEGKSGLKDAAAVILNRAAMTGKTPYEIVTQDAQFSAYKSPGSEVKNAFTDPKAIRTVEDAWNDVETNGPPEGLENATHYVRKDVNPSWRQTYEAQGKGLGQRGNHVFYASGEFGKKGYQPPQRSAPVPQQSTSSLQSALTKLRTQVKGPTGAGDSLALDPVRASSSPSLRYVAPGNFVRPEFASNNRANGLTNRPVQTVPIGGDGKPALTQDVLQRYVANNPDFASGNPSAQRQSAGLSAPGAGLTQAQLQAMRELPYTAPPPNEVRVAGGEKVMPYDVGYNAGATTPDSYRLLPTTTPDINGGGAVRSAYGWLNPGTPNAAVGAIAQATDQGITDPGALSPQGPAGPSSIETIPDMVSTDTPAIRAQHAELAKFVAQDQLNPDQLHQYGPRGRQPLGPADGGKKSGNAIVDALMGGVGNLFGGNRAQGGVNNVVRALMGNGFIPAEQEMLKRGLTIGDVVASRGETDRSNKNAPGSYSP